MPVVEIEATEWSYSHDLDDAGSAADYRAKYLEGDLQLVWDPSLHQSTIPYQGQSNPQIVAIIVTTDGLQRELVRGVVDSASWSHDLIVTGELFGRDQMALLLDRFPSETFVIKGAEVNPATGGLTYHNTFASAVQLVCGKAGVPVSIGNVVNYLLGNDVVLSQERTYAQTLAELLGPLRWSERHKVDAFMEGNVLYVRPRSQPVGTVSIEAARIKTPRFVKSIGLIAGGDDPPKVRIEGFSYQREVSGIPGDVASRVERYALHGDIHEQKIFVDEDGKYTDKPPKERDEEKGKEPARPIPGLPWFTGYMYSPEEREVSLTVQGITESYTVKEIEYYDSQGRLTGTYKRTDWQSKSRWEEHRSSVEFEWDGTKVSYGNKISEYVIHFVHAVAYAYNEENELVTDIHEVVHEKKSEWTYWWDNGDTQSMDSFEVIKDESAQKSPLPLKERVITKQRFRRSMGQIWRDTEVITFDDTGLIERSFEVREIGPFKISWTAGVVGVGVGVEMGKDDVAGPGKTMQTVVIVARPADGSVLVEGGTMPGDANYLFSSGLIGDPQSASQIRNLILSDWATKVDVTLAFMPDVRVKPARTLEVANADSWWDAISFFVFGVQCPTHTSEMVVQGVAWL